MTAPQRSDEGEVPVLTAEIARAWLDSWDTSNCEPYQSALRALASGKTVCVPSPAAPGSVRSGSPTGKDWKLATPEAAPEDAGLVERLREMADRGPGAYYSPTIREAASRIGALTGKDK